MKPLNLITLLVALVALAGCACSKPVSGTSAPPAAAAPTYSEKGIASWYGGKWHGRKTANGERYNKWSMTAAHKKLPFNTWVQVTNVATGQSVQVRINNRGPFRKNRILDLSLAAARELGFEKSGLCEITLTVIPAPETPADTKLAMTSRSDKKAN